MVKGGLALAASGAGAPYGVAILGYLGATEVGSAIVGKDLVSGRNLEIEERAFRSVIGAVAVAKGYSSLKDLLATPTEQLMKSVDVTVDWDKVKGDVGGDGTKAEIGNKLDYPLGKATGNIHNIQRSQTMANELGKIGINDTPECRAALKEHLNEILNDSSNIIKNETRVYNLPGQPPIEYTVTVRESFFIGPSGGVKFETIWDGNKLLTIIVKGGK